jgi:uncharacterized protein (DUF1800 family)
LELHTLGVNGGYTQEDVGSVARAFTGWTIGRGGEGVFRFARGMHDTGTKVLLGRTIGGRGEEEGERVLDLLAANPATARHIAAKLARRFVSDAPPPALVARAAKRFEETGGDIREVVRVVVTSPEFFAPEARHAKVKTPLEFVVSIFRLEAEATGNADLRPALRALRELGMPLYYCQPPTGYDDTGDTWITPGALVTRVNLARQLAPRAAALASAPEFQKK